MGELIATIGRFQVFWDKFSGDVYVGTEHAGEAYTKQDALNVARNYISRYG